MDETPPCKTDPRAPHGFDRNASHSVDRYVCECEGWEPPELRTKVGTNSGVLHTEWVGLTDEEVKKIVDKNTSDDYGYDIWCNGKGVARDVEDKLKEKNT
jgi:hypothetical protein